MPVLPLAILAAATLLAVLFTGQVWLDYAYARVPISWARAFGVSAIDWYVWALLTPLIWRLTSHVPFRRDALRSAFLVHVPLSLVLTVGKTMAQEGLARLVAGVTQQPTSFLRIYMTLLTYWGIVGIGAAIAQQRDRRERELRATRLEAELARAQLDALQTRLHPHFLFNTLNGISALMRENVEAADLMLTRLSDLLRITLAGASAQQVPLADELAFVEQYLDIQRLRFGDRLTVLVDVAPDTLSMLVPRLALQPLVENALRHGAEQKPGPATLTIRARRVDGRLVLDVIDDGPGPPEDPRDGTGLDTTRQRLRHLHGNAASLVLQPAEGGGALARLTIP